MLNGTIICSIFSYYYRNFPELSKMKMEKDCDNFFYFILWYSIWTLYTRLVVLVQPFLRKQYSTFQLSILFQLFHLGLGTWSFIWLKFWNPCHLRMLFVKLGWNWMDYSMDLECPKRQIHWLIGKIWKAIEKYHLTLVLIVELDRKKREYWCFSWMIEGIKVEKWQKIFTRHGVMKCMMMTLLLIWVQRSSKHQNVGLWKGNYNMIGQKITTLNRSGSWYEMHE